MSVKAALGQVKVEQPSDLVEARQAVKLLVEQLGFDRFDQVQLATGASELGRAVIAHGGGHLAVSLSRTAPPRLVIEVRLATGGSPRGDLESSEGFLAARRLIGGAPDGVRLPAVSRLLPSAAKGINADAIEAVLRREPRDPYEEVANQNAEVLGLLDDLRRKDVEIASLNVELEETNRGVLALYSELDERAEAVHKASEDRSRFLSNVTHELRTPLSSILALCRLFEADQGTLGPEHIKQVGYIQKSAQDLYDFVSDLLDLAKIDAGKVEVRPAEFAVADLFSALRGMFRPLTTDPELALRFELGEVPPLRTDESKVAQILRNLVSNGLKFTERGVVTVSAQHDEAAGMVVFRVSDTGPGIPGADLERIFEEFVQVGSGTRRRARGSGLGLPLSRNLAGLLGGTLTVESEVGVGTTFTLRIPCKYSRVPGVGGTVLVVDDDDVSRYVVKEHLEDAGWRVIEASDGEMALALAAEGSTDALVLDLIMPGMSGFEVLDRLGEDPRTSGIPVAIRTSLPTRDIDPESVSRAVGVFSKDDPTLQPLLDAISTATDSARLSISRDE